MSPQGLFFYWRNKLPWKPRTYCKSPGCNQLVDTGYCEKHKQVKTDSQPSRNSTALGYNARWQRARLMYLREHPLCVECLKSNVVCAASVVDHIEPHKGDMELFWDEDNWQSLCKRHHDKKTGKEK